MADSGIMGDITAILAEPSVENTETTEVETPVTETEVETPETETPETEESAESKDTKKAEKPLTASQMRDVLKRYRDANPNDARALKQASEALSRVDALEQVFPKRQVDGKWVGGVDEARAIKTAVDAVGGIEGLSQQSAVVQSVEATDALLDAGNPELLTQIKADSPEGYKKLFPHILSDMVKFDNDHFNKTMQPFLFRGVVSAGLPKTISSLTQALVAGGTADQKLATVKELVDGLAGWFNEQKQLAEQSGSAEANPVEERLTARERALQEKEDGFFFSTVKTATNSHIMQTYGSLINPILAANPGLTDRNKRDIASAMLTESTNILSKDAAYQRQMKALTTGAKRDSQKAIEFGKAAISKIAPEVMKIVVGDYKLRPATKAGTKAAPAVATPASGAKTGSGASGSRTNPIRVKDKPAKEHWDDVKTDEDAILKGMCCLKNGRWVRWR